MSCSLELLPLVCHRIFRVYFLIRIFDNILTYTFLSLHRWRKGDRPKISLCKLKSKGYRVTDSTHTCPNSPPFKFKSVDIRSKSQWKLR